MATCSIAALAPPPFDTAGRGADLVILTSDGTVLYVVKAFLIYASPFFDNLLGDSSPEETYENLPVYRSAEDCRTMCAVVRLCYPLAIELETMTEAVLDALQKYIMEDVQERLKDAIRSSEMMKTDPIRVYAFACRYRWLTIARAAAKEILRIPLLDWKNSAELRSITGMDYHLLQQYFLECARASVDALSAQHDPSLCAITISREDRSSLQKSCSCSGLHIWVRDVTGSQLNGYYGHKWLTDFILQARTRLRDCPRADITSDELMGIAVHAAGKTQCTESAAHAVWRVVRFIDHGLQAVIEKVELNLDF